MKHYFIASGVTDDKMKRTNFLSRVGIDTFELLQKLSNNELTAKTFNDIKALKIKHFVEKQHVLAEQF